MTPPYSSTIVQVRRALDDTFAEVDTWFDRWADLRAYRPADGGWSIDQVLEHITLTNHFLLIIIRKGAVKCGKRAAAQGLPASGESDLAKLQVIGERGSFPWPRPAHMEPAGRPIGEVRRLMASQLDECRSILATLPAGTGSLYAVRMSVNDSGKLDMYQYLYFVAQHARRHLHQMRAAGDEFLRP